jgi:Zn-dependent M32 family carboxypeptidase
VHAAIVTETLRLADSLLRQAARDIEATLFERVLDRLRSELPELVDRVLEEHSAAAVLPAKTRD